MKTKKVALVGYPAEYFLPFGQSLEQAGFEVYWICSLMADARHLLLNGVPSEQILNTNEGFRAGTTRPEACAAELARFENSTAPLFHDIFLMDRLLREKPWQFAQEYLAHIAVAVDQFLQMHDISLLSSWRDTALQLTSMLVARHAGIPFIVPTRMRIPQEVYGFCTEHHTDSFLALRPVTNEDERWAADFLDVFEKRGVKPALKKSTRSFVDVLRLMPSHLRAFMYEARRSAWDAGNDYARYPLRRLVGMYVRRRFNLARYKLLNPSTTILPQGIPFCLYALHTQPESSVDVQASFFSNQEELIRQIARSLPASHLLYVKVHPTDVDGRSLGFYHRIRAIPGVVLVDYSVDSRTLTDRASIIFALTGTIAYEAGLLRRPVVVFARNYFNRLPTIHHCESPTALPQLVAQLLRSEAANPARREAVVSFLAQMRANCFDGEVSRTYGASNERLRPDDLSQLQIAYAALTVALNEAAAK